MGVTTHISGASVQKRPPHQRFLPAARSEDGAERRLDRGLFPEEPVTCRRALWPFLHNLAFLGLLLLVFRLYRVEERVFPNRAFQTLMMLAFVAMPIHYLAPFRWKKTLFISVSIVGLYSVFGIQVATVVLLLAALLIGSCSLPIPWIGRVAIISSLAVAMGFTRSMAHAIIPENVWPVIASMFMFRIVLYLYELNHLKKPEALVDTLCYFFLLPNFCFMHFPVVDYRTMQRGYFADDVHAMQRRGIKMMFNGTLHLLSYRLVYHKLLIAPSQVHDFLTLGGYVICNYLLYLQVSGQFHLACGVLHLFGFNVPVTHHHYLFASGFTDYWRRINIYWKDFMVRLFFNPVAFRFKHWPQPAVLVLATTSVFFATWFLHAYQSYWLLGTWGFTTPSALFWAILGVLVLVNVQIDARRCRNRKLAQSLARMAFIEHALRAVRIAGTFSVVALLWSLWSSPSLSAWLDVIQRGLNGP